MSTAQEQILNQIYSLPEPEQRQIVRQLLAKAFRSPKFWRRLIMAVDSANRLGHGEIRDEHRRAGLREGFKVESVEHERRVVGWHGLARQGVAQRIVWAWVFTIPAAAAVGAVNRPPQGLRAASDMAGRRAWPASRSSVAATCARPSCITCAS